MPSITHNIGRWLNSSRFKVHSWELTREEEEVNPIATTCLWDKEATTSLHLYQAVKEITTATNSPSSMRAKEVTQWTSSLTLTQLLQIWRPWCRAQCNSILQDKCRVRLTYLLMGIFSTLRLKPNVEQPRTIALMPSENHPHISWTRLAPMKRKRSNSPTSSCLCSQSWFSHHRNCKKR